MRIAELREFLDVMRLKARLDYDPSTGVFTWKYSSEMSESWNSRYAGYRAGYVRDHITCQYSTRAIALYGVKVLEHHLAWLYMTGEWPPKDMVIDHRNRDATDNHWDNLRLVTHATNNKNMSKRKNNKSGVTGVWWVENMKAYIARVTINGTIHRLGFYSDIKEAERVVKEFRKEHGFSESHGQSGVVHKRTEKKPRSLVRNSKSGCRYISWASHTKKWTVRIEEDDGSVATEHTPSIEDAKRILCDLLARNPNHPYHGVQIPD